MTAVSKTAGCKPTGVRFPHPGRTVQPYKHRRPPVRLAARQSGGRCRRTPGGESAAARRAPRERQGRLALPQPSGDRRAAWKDALASLVPRRTVPLGTVPPIGGTISGCTVPGTIPAGTVPPGPLPRRAGMPPPESRRRPGSAWRSSPRRAPPGVSPTKADLWRRPRPPSCRREGRHCSLPAEPCRHLTAPFLPAIAGTIPARRHRAVI